MAGLRIRVVLAVAAAGLMLVAQPSVANAGTYPPQCVTDVSDVTPDVGGTFTVTISGNPLNNGEDFIFSFQGQTQIRVLTNGTASASFVAPAFPGTYAGTVVLAPNIPCGAFSVSVESGIIPPTGSDSTQTTLLLGASAVGLGGLMLVVAYRRRQQLGHTTG